MEHRITHEIELDKAEVNEIIRRSVGVLDEKVYWVEYAFDGDHTLLSATIKWTDRETEPAP